MKKVTLSMIALMMCLAFVGGGLVFAEKDEGVNKDVELTTEQKQELESMYEELFNQHSQIVDKYVEFGVYSEEKAEKIKTKMLEGHEKLKENGYIPKWDRHKKGKKEEE